MTLVFNKNRYNKFKIKNERSLVEWIKIIINNIFIIINVFVSIVNILINFYFSNYKKVHDEKLIENEKEKIELERKKILYVEVKNNNDIIVNELLELKKYYELFTLEGYDFKESEISENFAPLEKKEKFNENIGKSYYYLDLEIKKIIDEIKESLEIHCKIALYIAMNKIEKENKKEIQENYLDQVEQLSYEMVEKIEKVIFEIRNKEYRLLMF